MDDAIERAYEIGEAAYALSQRGLFSAASWITELVSRPDPEAKIQIEAAVRNGRNNAQLHFDKSQNYAMGLNYFRMKEHLRAAERFALCSSIEATFMRFYSMYCFEVQKRSALPHGLGEEGDGLRNLRSQIYQDVLVPRVKDPFIYFLYGIVTDGKKAREHLCLSLSGFPYNWDAWMALVKHVKDPKSYDEIEDQLPHHWMNIFFKIVALSKLRRFQKVLDLLKQLQEVFPQSNFFSAELAKCLYHVGQYDTSLACFNGLLTADPERTKDLDVYAKLLYVLDKKAELAQLANRFLETHKFTPEACSIIGHSYSIKMDHEKAIAFFRRALKLDPDCLNAKLFIAQEYMEIRDYASALQAAQQVIDRDARNPNAWHLLGQAYELGEATELAEEAFSRACCLNPHNGSFWLSRGFCNLRMNKLKIAEEFLTRAKQKGCNDDAVDIYLKAQGPSTRIALRFVLQEVQEKLYPGLSRDEDAQGH